MTDNFTPVSLDFMAAYRRLLAACESKASDYSFGNLWGWGKYYGLEWRFDGTLCWVRQNLPEQRNWAPVGPWREVDWASSPVLTPGAEFIRVPEALYTLWQEALPGRVEIIETRGQWDYLYKADDLAELSGNRFHKKKNLVNQFLKLYNHNYHDLTSDCVESVLDMQAEWAKWNEVEESPSLQAENEAVARVLESWDSIPGLFGGVLRVDGNVVAYTVAEPVCTDTLVIHFEKGSLSYKGVYQAINNRFARDVAPAFNWLNREQDLDDEGLRKAKESYNPADFVKKNIVRIH